MKLKQFVISDKDERYLLKIAKNDRVQKTRVLKKPDPLVLEFTGFCALMGFRDFFI